MIREHTAMEVKEPYIPWAIADYIHNLLVAELLP